MPPTNQRAVLRIEAEGRPHLLGACLSPHPRERARCAHPHQAIHDHRHVYDSGKVSGD